MARAGGFREAARAAAGSASGYSEAVNRLGSQTRGAIAQPHHAASLQRRRACLLERLVPALGEVEAVFHAVNAFRDRLSGTVRVNVLATVARLVLPSIVAPFLKAYPDI